MFIIAGPAEKDGRVKPGHDEQGIVALPVGAF
jgi:hypothetical protein